METVTFDKDINVMYKTASSFPDGVLTAHQSLHALIPFTTTRRYFGISRPENGAIAYKAAAEEKTPGEAEKLNCETLVLKKGNYLSITIPNFMKDIPAIEKIAVALADRSVKIHLYSQAKRLQIAACTTIDQVQAIQWDYVEAQYGL